MKIPKHDLVNHTPHEAQKFHSIYKLTIMPIYFPRLVLLQHFLEYCVYRQILKKVTYLLCFGVDEMVEIQEYIVINPFGDSLVSTVVKIFMSRILRRGVIKRLVQEIVLLLFLYLVFSVL